MTAKDGTRSLMRLLSLGRHRESRRIVMKLELQPFVHLDESGKWKDSDMICLCGFLATDERWTAFLREWDSALRKHNMRRIHMTEFWHEAKKQKWTDDKAFEVLNEFLIIIRDHVLVGFSVAFDAKYFCEKVVDARRKRFTASGGDPALFCFQRMLRKIRDRLDEEGYPGRIVVTMDMEEGTVAKTASLVIALRKRNPDLHEYIGAISFADDEFIMPLQAADVFANLTGRWMKEVAAGRRTRDEMSKELHALLTFADGKQVDVRSEIWDGDEIERAIDSVATSPEQWVGVKPITKGQQ